MADILIPVAGGFKRLRDMGDGSWAEVVSSGGGAAGTPAGGVQSVQGVAGGTPIPNQPAQFRGTEFAHRVNVTAPDVLGLVPAFTLSAITEAGSVLAAVAYHVGVAAGNRHGVTTPTLDSGTITPTASQAVRATITPVTGAEYYEIFLSTAAAPLYVGRVSAADLLAGNKIISTNNVVTTRAGATVANTIDIGVVGLGVATTAIPFTVNSALTPELITPIVGTGFGNLLVMCKITTSDNRAVSSFNLRYMMRSVLSPTDWFGLAPNVIAPLSTAAAFGQMCHFGSAISGAAGVVIVTNNWSANIQSVDIWTALL